MTNTVAVRVRGCECPGTPHADKAAYNGSGDIDGDVVFLRAKPSMPLGLAVQADIIRTAGSPVGLLKRAWAMSYIREGVVGWNFTDEKGEVRPLDLEELIDDFDMGMAVCEKADELYGDRVVSPLLEAMFPASTETSPQPSQPGLTTDSTSPNRASRRSRSKRSSPATTAGTTP